MTHFARTCCPLFPSYYRAFTTDMKPSILITSLCIINKNIRFNIRHFGMSLANKTNENKMHKQRPAIVDSVRQDKEPQRIRQVVLGIVSGWCTGYVYTPLFKLVAVAFSGGIILLVLASKRDYIKIDWDKIKDTTGIGRAGWMQKNRQLIRDNKYLVAGFVVGFLLSMDKQSVPNSSRQLKI